MTRLFFSLFVLLISLATQAMTAAECHSYCANPNHPNCSDSGSRLPKELYLPFLKMLKAVPGTDLAYDGNDPCKRTTAIVDGKLINSGEDCHLKYVEPYDAYAYFMSLTGQYEGKVSEGADQDGKVVKQIEFATKHLPESYAKDARGNISYHIGKQIDSVTYNKHGMLLGTDELCIFASWKHFK